jgi:hypothetical protein
MGIFHLLWLKARTKFTMLRGSGQKINLIVGVCSYFLHDSSTVHSLYSFANFTKLTEHKKILIFLLLALSHKVREVLSRMSTEFK